jgi:hypothetical protein
LTENSQYGGEWGRTIIFSAVPVIIALPAKVLVYLLNYEGTFQYQGIQLLISFFLIIYYCIRLAIQEGLNFLNSVIFALLVVLSPFFLFRELFPHYTFGIFWIIPASIFYLRRLQTDQDFKSYTFPILIFVSVNWMPYFVVFPLLLWFFGRATHHNPDVRIQKWRSWCAKETLLVIFSLASFPIINGVSTFSGSGDAGVGYCNANMLALIDSRSGSSTTWSQLLPGIGTSTPCQYEGFAFIGTGSLIMCLIIILVYLLSQRGRNRIIMIVRKYNLLLMLAAVMFAFSIGGSFAIGTKQIYKIDLEGWPIFSTFRATGRFMMFVSFLCVFIILVSISSIFSQKKSFWIAFICLVVSVLDAYPAISTIHQKQNMSYKTSVEILSLLETAQPKKVVFVEPEPSAPFWKMEIILESALRKIPVNDGFIARSIPTELQDEKKRALDQFSKLQDSPKILFILYPEFIKNNKSLVTRLISGSCSLPLREGAIAVWASRCK